MDFEENLINQYNQLKSRVNIKSGQHTHPCTIKLLKSKKQFTSSGVMRETQTKKPMKRTAIVYLVAGLSSRFGGKIKQFAEVGPKGETLIEVSMQQAIKAGFKEIIFIVGEKTQIPFEERFGNIYMNAPIYYANQSFDPRERDKPWGTVDALLSAKDVVTSPFAVCNGDDLYGVNSFKKVRKFLEENEDEKGCIAIGYVLGKVIPKKGSTNRAIFSVDKKGFVTNLNEVIGIEKSKLKEQKLNEKDLCSMNLFGMREETLILLEKQLNEFKKTHKEDRKSECYLPVELSALVKEKKIKMKLEKTTDEWLGVTNPEDEEIVRENLSKQK